MDPKLKSAIAQGKSIYLSKLEEEMDKKEVERIKQENQMREVTAAAEKWIADNIFVEVAKAESKGEKGIYLPRHLNCPTLKSIIAKIDGLKVSTKYIEPRNDIDYGYEPGYTEYYVSW